MESRELANIRITESKYQSLAIYAIILLCIIYIAAFALGVYTGYENSKVYHETTSHIYRSLRNSTILKMYNETLNYVLQGNVSLAVSNIVYLTLHETSYDFFSALIPIIPSYTFYIHGIISAPVTLENKIILITALPLILGKVLGYSIIGSVTIIFIIDRLFLKKQILLLYLQRLIVGFILLVFISLDDLLYSMITDLLYSP